MREPDTSAEAETVQLAVLRRLGPEGRLRIAVQLSDDIRSIALEGVRRRHPGLREDEVRRELVRILYGDALVGLAYPLPSP